MRKFFESIRSVIPIRIEWNVWNGFVLTILGVVYQGEKKGFEGDLLGVYISKEYFYFYILFIEFEVKSPIR